MPSLSAASISSRSFPGPRRATCGGCRWAWQSITKRLGRRLAGFSFGLFLGGVLGGVLGDSRRAGPGRREANARGGGQKLATFHQDGSLGSGSQGAVYPALREEKLQIGTGPFFGRRFCRKAHLLAKGIEPVPSPDWQSPRLAPCDSRLYTRTDEASHQAPAAQGSAVMPCCWRSNRVEKFIKHPKVASQLRHHGSGRPFAFRLLPGFRVRQAANGQRGANLIRTRRTPPTGCKAATPLRRRPLASNVFHAHSVSA